MRPKCNQFRVRTALGSGIHGSGEELPRARAAQPFEILLVLHDGAERRLHGAFGELSLAERDQRAGPVQGLGNAGQLIEVEPPDAADERADLAGQLRRGIRDTRHDDLVLPLHRG